MAATTGAYPDIGSAHEFVYARETSGSRQATGIRVEMSFSEALRQGHECCLSELDNCYLMGLGVPDPKGIFGTTLGLNRRFGNERVFDIPLSENAMTGVCIGSAITGMRPILTHQRLDFSLVAIDQIVNQAAKWHYMFNGAMSVPMVIRMIVGRGWGQGPQHSQNLQAWFAHIPGLKVLVPSNAFDAKGMLIAAVMDDSPVVIIEHRWLHETRDLVPECAYTVPIHGCSVVRGGEDITLASMGYGVKECVAAAKDLEAQFGISAEVIDIRVVRPLDIDSIMCSVRKTRRLVVLDYADQRCSIASEVIASLAETENAIFAANPSRLTLPSYPCPTSHALTKDYYPTSQEVVKEALRQLGRDEAFVWKGQDDKGYSDQPNSAYIGPF